MYAGDMNYCKVLSVLIANFSMLASARLSIVCSLFSFVEFCKDNNNYLNLYFLLLWKLHELESLPVNELTLLILFCVFLLKFMVDCLHATMSRSINYLACFNLSFIVWPYIIHLHFLHLSNVV